MRGITAILLVSVAFYAGGFKDTTAMALRGKSEDLSPRELRKLLGYDDNLCGDFDTAAASAEPAISNMTMMGRLVENNLGCYELSKEECCYYMDGRRQYSGQLCVPPINDEFSNGNECEPANFASRNLEGQFASCGDVMEPAAMEMMMDYPDIRFDECTLNSFNQMINQNQWVMDPNLSEDELQQLCEAARQEYYASSRGQALQIHDIIEQSEEFVTEYYLGQGPWNLETEDNQGNNELAEDAAIIDEVQDTIVEHQRLADPSWLSQCSMNAAMCVWRRDRQANDNNGNCATPYEQNCVDAEPADNADICYSVASASTRTYSGDMPPSDTYLGMTEFKRSNQGCYQLSYDECCHRIDGRNDQYGGQRCVRTGNPDIRFRNGFQCEPLSFVLQSEEDTAKMGFCPSEALGFAVQNEEEIHAHGFAWNDGDETEAFRANVLFYVSFYDHLYTRGYVENVQGAPMCGCLEEMPIVSRSDCTYPVVEEGFVARFDMYGAFQGIQQRDVEIEFNACNGNTNNDLYSYIRDRLDLNEEEHRYYLVGPENNNDNSNSGSNCNEVIEERFGQDAENAVTGEMIAQQQQGVSCEDVRWNFVNGNTCWGHAQNRGGSDAAYQQVAELYPYTCGPCRNP